MLAVARILSLPTGQSRQMMLVTLNQRSVLVETDECLHRLQMTGRCQRGAYPVNVTARGQPGYLSVICAVAESRRRSEVGNLNCTQSVGPRRERFGAVPSRLNSDEADETEVSLSPACPMWVRLLGQKEDIVRNITYAVLIFAATCGFGSPAIFAQNKVPDITPGDVIVSDAAVGQQFAALRKDIRSVRKQIIAANLTLTDDEAPKFWPVYEEYSGELQKITDLRLALIQEYAEDYETLSDDQADTLISRWLDADVSADQLRQKYAPIMRKVLSAKKAATFFQLERQISMTIEIHLTSRLPLMQSQE